MLRTVTACLLLAVAALPACSKGAVGEDPPPAGTPGPEAQAKAAQIFQQRCTPCHGAEGRGDGAASATLQPKPRNFHEAAWQQKVTDDHIVTIIKSGGAAVGLSPAMPSNPDLNDPAVLAALKDHIRGFGKSP